MLLNISLPLEGDNLLNNRLNLFKRLAIEADLLITIVCFDSPTAIGLALGTDDCLLEVPQFMFDDGTKTYIKIRKENKNNLPTIYYYDSRIPKDKLQLVNYRIKGEFFEIDRVAQSWKIVYQQDAYLVVERNNKAKIAKKSSINLQQGNTHEALEYIANKNLNYPNKVVLLDQKESLTSVEKQRLNEINTIVDKKVDESVSIKLQDKEVVIDSSGTGSGQSNVSADQELQNALADIQNQRSQATLTM